MAGKFPAKSMRVRMANNLFLLFKMDHGIGDEMGRTMLNFKKFRSNDRLFQLKIMGIVLRRGIFKGAKRRTYEKPSSIKHHSRPAPFSFYPIDIDPCPCQYWMYQ
jgi:hypothetical protein